MNIELAVPLSVQPMSREIIRREGGSGGVGVRGRGGGGGGGAGGSGGGGGGSGILSLL